MHTFARQSACCNNDAMIIHWRLAGSEGHKYLPEHVNTRSKEKGGTVLGGLLQVFRA